ncbi:Ultraviolet-B receptor UVR8 [Porphyridium purpureum]|uniref:Ultraviolet-B receptor UVR8 n=1 Tax=Porphyridium purpureum TaxID=35688 RepID=A0A5J4YJS8_PORPP|nr:Ultraviolet-B receptor UVR8 [Porphyridium purpureum]|eukprot:POR3669..scf246_12
MGPNRSAGALLSSIRRRYVGLQDVGLRSAVLGVTERRKSASMAVDACVLEPWFGLGIVRSVLSAAAAAAVATVVVRTQQVAHADDQNSGIRPMRRSTSVYACGLNLSGQLGNGSDRVAASPVPLTDLSSDMIVKVAAGNHSSAAVSGDGRLFTWGNGSYGILGHGDEANLSLPRQIESLGGSGATEAPARSSSAVTDVAVGGFHMLCTTASGQLFSWGQGQAHARKGDASIPMPVTDVPRPVVSISTGRKHSAVVTDDGAVYTWGSGHSGALGHGSKVDEAAPKRVSALEGIRAVQVACGRDFTLILTDTGDVYSCGADDFGQLGNGRSHGERFVRLPKKVLLGHANHVIRIAAGDYHAVATDSQGALFSWGYNRDGQLGNGEKTDTAIPKPVVLPSPGASSHPKPKIDALSCGGGHTAVVVNGDLLVFGRGRDGQLGRGTELESNAAYRTTPVRVESVPRGQVRGVAAGADHTLILVAATD